MSNDCRWTDLEYTPDIPNTCTIYSHINDTIMSAWLVGVVGICKLKTLLAAMAEVSLVFRLGFTIFNDTSCLMAMDTGNLYYSHEAPTKI